MKTILALVILLILASLAGLCYIETLQVHNEVQGAEQSMQEHARGIEITIENREAQKLTPHPDRQTIYIEEHGPNAGFEKKNPEHKFDLLFGGLPVSATC